MRSKVKQTHRATKRSSAKSDYAILADARMTRLASKLHAGPKPTVAPNAMIEDVADAEPAEEPMQVDEKKVSTSGPRAAGRKAWKAARGHAEHKVNKAHMLKKKRGKDGSSCWTLSL
jgi:hypothetical protein